jgi:hypothetical protein
MTLLVERPARHCNPLGSMLWSLFLAIFTNFRRKNGVLAFFFKKHYYDNLSNQIAIIWVKIANFFSIFFAKISFQSNFGPRCSRVTLNENRIWQD